jgi:hypothetical protein
LVSFNLGLLFFLRVLVLHLSVLHHQVVMPRRGGVLRVLVLELLLGTYEIGTYLHDILLLCLTFMASIHIHLVEVLRLLPFGGAGEVLSFVLERCYVLGLVTLTH